MLNNNRVILLRTRVERHVVADRSLESIVMGELSAVEQIESSQSELVVGEESLFVIADIPADVQLNAYGSGVERLAAQVDLFAMARSFERAFRRGQSRQAHEETNAKQHAHVRVLVRANLINVSTTRKENRPFFSFDSYVTSRLLGRTSNQSSEK